MNSSRFIMAKTLVKAMPIGSWMWCARRIRVRKLNCRMAGNRIISLLFQWNNVILQSLFYKEIEQCHFSI